MHDRFTLPLPSIVSRSRPRRVLSLSSLRHFVSGRSSTRVSNMSGRMSMGDDASYSLEENSFSIFNLLFAIYHCMKPDRAHYLLTFYFLRLMFYFKIYNF